MTLRHGYFTGAGYTYGAYSEPSPERLAFLCLLRGQRPPDLARPFRLLELGCGQGFHLCLQAANYPQAHFVGIDFKPDHIAHASSLARAAELSNITFLQADVLDLVQDHSALGQPFDLVVVHGVLGWVSPRVGAAVLDLSASTLRPGGLLYLSYNTLPGWLPALPFQHSIRSLQGDHGDGLPALEAAKSLFEAILQAKGQIFEAQPSLASRLERLNTLDPAYLLHEYNHREWQPLYANQVIDQASELGLSYLGSATLVENFEGLLPESYRQLLKQYSDPAMRELVRDLLTNQAFRRDVFVYGQDPLWSLEARSSLESQHFLGLADSQLLDDEAAFKFRLGFGEVNGNRQWFESLMHQLKGAPCSLAELHAALPETSLPELLQNLVLLMSKGLLVLVPPERDPAPALRFNHLLLERVAAGAPYSNLACPVSGNIDHLSDLNLFAVRALLQGRSQDDLIHCLDTSLQDLDRKPLRDGQAVEGRERQALLQQISDRFCQRTLPRLRRLGVLP